LSRYDSEKSSLKPPLKLRIRFFNCGLLSETTDVDILSNALADAIIYPCHTKYAALYSQHIEHFIAPVNFKFQTSSQQ